MANKQLNFGKDLLLTPFFEADDWDTLDLCTKPLLRVAGADELVDLGTAADIDNLRQAIVLRLLTPLGILSDLGHAAYGSRLQELVGELNTPVTRNRAKVYVLQALAQEPRVAKVTKLVVQPPKITGRTDTLRIDIDILPLDSSDPLRVGLEVAL
jgi:phage baseplate assembly protein W